MVWDFTLLNSSLSPLSSQFYKKCSLRFLWPWDCNKCGPDPRHANTNMQLMSISSLVLPGKSTHLILKALSAHFGFLHITKNSVSAPCRCYAGRKKRKKRDIWSDPLSGEKRLHIDNFSVCCPRRYKSCPSPDFWGKRLGGWAINICRCAPPLLSHSQALTVYLVSLESSLRWK